MRIAVVYSSRSRKFDGITRAILATLQSQGHTVDEIRTEKVTRIPSLFQYELVFVGSAVEGAWGGKFSESLESFIKKCSGLQGKRSVVFVYPRPLGTSKAMKRIMKRLEEKGSIVIDFRSIKTVSQAREFARRLGERKNRLL